MKLIKVAFAVAVAALVGPAYAFHDGGVAPCESCHTMHNSSAKETGALAPQMTNNDVGVNTNTNPYLLQGQDASSTCLACHGATSAQSYHVLDTNTLAVAGQANLSTWNMTPGGEFGWNAISVRKGHTVIAADYTTALPNAAETRKVPPGYNGAWTGADFSCVSCHDPHGQSRLTSATTWGRPVQAADGSVTATGMLPIAASGSYGGTKFADYSATETVGSYRLLGSNGWKPRTSPNQPVLATDPPLALAPGNYNASETTFALNATGHTGQTVVAYLKGMSEWCSNCHPGMHGQGSTGLNTGELKHPSGPTATLGGLATNYVKYMATGNLTGTAAYDALVPVELGIARDATAAGYATATTEAMSAIGTKVATGNVMCLTCHRAHASAFDSMMRWEVTTLDDIGSNGALTNTNTTHNNTIGYYARAANVSAPQYGTEQRMFCNKCHVKD